MLEQKWKVQEKDYKNGCHQPTLLFLLFLHSKLNGKNWKVQKFLEFWEKNAYIVSQNVQSTHKNVCKNWNFSLLKPVLPVVEKATTSWKCFMLTLLVESVLCLLLVFLLTVIAFFYNRLNLLLVVQKLLLAENASRCRLGIWVLIPPYHRFGNSSRHQKDNFFHLDILEEARIASLNSDFLQNNIYDLHANIG